MASWLLFLGSLLPFFTGSFALFHSYKHEKTNSIPTNCFFSLLFPPQFQDPMLQPSHCKTGVNKQYGPASSQVQAILY